MEGAPLINPEAPKIETKDDSESEKDKKKRRGLFERRTEDSKEKGEERRRFLEFSDKESAPEDKKDKSIFAAEEKPRSTESSDKADPAESIQQEASKVVENEVEPVSAAEAPDNEVGEAEKPVAYQELARHELESHETPTVDPEADPEAAAEELASEVYWEEVAKHGDPQAAMAEAAAAAGATPEEAAELNAEEAPEEIAETEAIDSDEDEPIEVEAEMIPDERAEELNEPQEFKDEELILDRSAAESGPEDGREDPNLAAAAAASAAGAAGAATVAASSGSSAAGGGGAGGPNIPFAPAGHGPGGHGPGGINFHNAGFNAMPAAAANTAANTLRTPNTIEDRANPATMALVGGIIGYLIGRRRGRIKTERKLKPIQRKLEKQVESMQFELNENDKKIRRLAREKAQQGVVPVEALAAKSAAAKAERAQRQPSIIEKAVKQTEKTHAKTERVKAPEARQLHAKPTQEKIGQVLIAAEAPVLLPIRNEAIRHRNEASRKNVEKATLEQAPNPIAQKRVETMNRTELLEMSEKIIVDGSSLRQIYETKLIGERGLRRLVAEHLRGGDIKKALRQEIVEREIDFERDPAMRDMSPAAASAGVSGKAALDQMLAKAHVPGMDANEQAAYYKARAAYETRHHEQQQKHRQLMDVSLISIILLLTGLVTYLILAGN